MYDFYMCPYGHSNNVIGQGWLDLHPSNMAAVFCANGKARTAVLMACFLRFEGEEPSTLEAYQRVWAKRDPELEPEQASSKLWYLGIGEDGSCATGFPF